MRGLVVVVALTMVQQVTGQKAAGRSSLPVPPGAVDVAQRTGQDAASVECDVRESYPAPKTTAYLMDAMARRGWKLSEGGGFRSPSWTIVGPAGSKRPSLSELTRGRPATHHTWEAWWRDPSGRGATFELEYTCPLEHQGLHSVWAHVRGSILGPEEASRREAERKRLHEWRCQIAHDSGEPPDPSCVK